MKSAPRRVSLVGESGNEASERNHRRIEHSMLSRPDEKSCDGGQATATGSRGAAFGTLALLAHGACWDTPVEPCGSVGAGIEPEQ